MTERSLRHAKDSPQEHESAKARSHDGLAATLQQSRAPESAHATEAAARAVSVAEIKNDCFVFAATIAKAVEHLTENLGIKRTVAVEHSPQVARPDRDESSRFSSSEFRATKLGKFHEGSTGISAWDGDLNKQLNRLDGASAIKPEHAVKLRAGIVQNTDNADKISAVQPRFEGIASIEKYIASSAPGAYAGVIADVVRKSAVELANKAPVSVDRTGILRTASGAANEVSAIFQQACHSVLRDEANGKDFKDINIAQAAKLATQVTGREHSIVRLSDAEEAKAAQRTFGRPVIAEQAADGSLRALFPGGDHRVEWKMKDGAPCVVPGSAREITEQVRLAQRDTVGDRTVPITPAERIELSAKMLSVRAEQIHEALHRNTFGFPQADRQAAVDMLNSMTGLDRQNLQRIYGAKYGGNGEPVNDVLKRELREKLGPQDCAIVRNALDRQEGKNNDAGNFLVAIAGVREGKAGSEKLLLQQLGSLSKPQIDQLDTDLRRCGTSISDCIASSEKLSPALREALPILTSGVDKRSQKDILQLTEIAARDKNIDVLAAAIGNNLPETIEAREHLQRLHADEWFKDAFQGHDRDIAADYLLEGRISIATIAEQSKQWFWNNKQDLMHALDSASDEEKNAYRNGRQIAEQPSAALTERDKEDLAYYNRVRMALRKNASEREFAQCDAKLLYDDSLLDKLCSKHSDGVLGTGFFGGHNKNELMTAVENMPKSQLDQFVGNKQYLTDLDNALQKFCSTDERVRLETVIEQKLSRVRAKAQYETTRTLHDLISDNETPEFAGLRIGRKYDGKAIIDGLKNMDINDRERYREDPTYRDEVHRMLDDALEGPEKALAGRMLAHVDRTGERPEFDSIDQVLYDAISPPTAIDAANHIQKAFTEDPSLVSRLRNPQNEPDRELSKYFSKAMYRSVLEHHHWMSQKDELEIEQKLMRDGRLSLDDRLKLCTNSGERLNEITHCTEPERAEILKHGLRDDIPIIGTLIGQLNDEQRHYAETVLHSRIQGSGPPSLEDRIRYHVVSSDRDLSLLRNSIEGATDAQKQHAREEYARKYDRDLDKDILTCVDDKDRLFFERALKRRSADAVEAGQEATQESFDTKLRALESRSGLADTIIASGHWDGSRDELLRSLDASAAMQAERALHGTSPDAETIHAHNQFIADAREIYQQSKEDVTNVAVDSAYTVGAAGAAICTGGIAAPLLAGAIAGGIARPAIKAGMLGEDFHPTSLQLTKEVALGSVSGALAAVGTEQVAELMQVGKVASSRAMSSVSGILGEATFKAGTTEAKNAAIAAAEKELCKKVQAGLGHVTEKDIDHVLNTLVKHGMNDQLKNVVRAKLSHELNVQLQQETRSFLQSYIRTLAQSSSALPRKLATESAVSSFANATNAATTDLSNWNVNSSLSDNLESLVDHTTDAAKTGAVLGLKASLTHFFTAPAIDLSKSTAIQHIQDHPHVKRYIPKHWLPDDTLAASIHSVPNPESPSGHDVILPRLKERSTVVVRDQHGFYKEIPNTVQYTLKEGDLLHTVLKPDQYATRDGAIITQAEARQRLLDLAAQHIPTADTQERFKKFHAEFEQRVVDPKELACTAHEVARLLENRGGALSPDKSVWLAEQVMHQLANPLAITQGRWPTCNVSVVEVALASDKPSQYARLIAEIAETAKFRNASGIVTNVAENNALHLDSDSRSMWQARLNHEEDLFTTDRSFASKVFQETACQIRWDNEGGIIGSRYARPGEVRMKFDLASLKPLMGGNGIQHQGSILTDPQIDSSFLPMIYQQISGEPSANFSVFEHWQARKVAGIDAGRLARVRSEQDFKDQIGHLKPDNWNVFVVDVRTGWIRDDNEKLLHSLGLNPQPKDKISVPGHVILGRKTNSGKLEIYNPWGPLTFHTGSSAVTAAELYSVLLREE